MRPSSSCTGIWTVSSLAEVPSTLRIPSSSLRRVAASSKRAAAASQGFFSFCRDMDSGDVNVATISLRFHYAIVGGEGPWSPLALGKSKVPRKGAKAQAKTPVEHGVSERKRAWIERDTETAPHRSEER